MSSCCHLNETGAILAEGYPQRPLSPKQRVGQQPEHGQREVDINTRQNGVGSRTLRLPVLREATIDSGRIGEQAIEKCS